MKFTMQMPFAVIPGPRCDGYYTAIVLDHHGRTVGGFGDDGGRSLVSQSAANDAAVRKARAWAQRVREHASK